MNRFTLVCCLFLTTNVFADGMTEYDWLTIGKPSGHQNVTMIGNDEREISFEFNDRGRGPKATTRVKLNQKGIPVFVEIKGLNYTKGEVNETFVVEGDQARWRSAVETGESSFDGDAFYLSQNGPPEYFAMLARAILNDDDGRLPLLPSGTATIEEVTSETVTHNQEQKSITLYAVNGLQPNPSYVWLDENQELFGIDFSWFAITPKGWGGQIPVLKQGQQDHTDSLGQRLSQELGESLTGLTVIRNTNVVDVVAQTVKPNQDVLLLDGRITGVVASRDQDYDETHRVVDGSGQFLMPALWDMHAHIQPQTYLNYIAMGVTNVRDMANDPEYILRARRDIREQKLAAPNIHAMGFIDKRNEFAAPTGMLADDLKDALDFVDYYADRDFYGIKLYSSIEPEWVKPIADRAHSRGLTVLGHIPSGMNAADALEAGFDEITHINMVMLNFLGARELDTRTPKRFTEVGERAGTVDWSSREVRRFLNTMAERGIAHDPTLSIFQHMFLNEPGTVSVVFRDIADHLPVLTRRAQIDSKSFNSGFESEYKQAANASKALLKSMHQAGIRLLPGTDNALPGMTLIRELEFYGEAGISNWDVLTLATLEPAKHLNLDHSYGTVERGKYAHLILLSGNPVDDLGNLYQVNTVIKEDRLYQSADILKRQGFEPF